MNTPAIVAMFQCQSVTINGNVPGGDTGETIQLVPVYGEANEPWSKFTPSGTLSMTITNPTAQGRIKVGEVYQITLTQTEESDRLQAAMK